MTEKIAKRIRWTIGILFLIASALGLASSFSLAIRPVSTWGPYWQELCNDRFYWASGFLFSGELSIVGLSFIVFPKRMMRVLIKNENDYKSIQTWRLIISGLVAGMPAFWIGIGFLLSLFRNWVTECSCVPNCI